MSVPIYQMLREDRAAEVVRGKIVLIGITDPLVQDFVFAPFAKAGNMPGIEAQANIVETLLSGNSVEEIPVQVSALAALVTSVMVGCAIARFREIGVMLGGTLALGIVWVVLTAFGAWSVWVRSVGVICGILSTIVTVAMVETGRGGSVGFRCTGRGTNAGNSASSSGT